MRGNPLLQVLLFVLLVLAALAAGALLAYPATLVFEEVPFSRLAERGSLLCGLLFSLWYLHRTMPVNVRAIGMTPPQGWLAGIVPAYIAGMAIMLVLAIGLWTLGLSHIDHSRDFTAAFFASALLKGLAAGIGAGLIEEILFRGALFSGLQTRINAPSALVLTSLLYAAVHFLSYPEPSGGVHWYTGFLLLPAAMHELGEPAILDHFLTLFLLGVLLSLLRLRDGHIWRAFGVHAGIIMIIKLDAYITNPSASDSLGWLVSETSARLGWLSAFWLLVLVIVYGLHCYRRQKS